MPTTEPIPIGYHPETAQQHLVPEEEPHPGDHLLDPDCPCDPEETLTPFSDNLVWMHRVYG